MRNKLADKYYEHPSEEKLKAFVEACCKIPKPFCFEAGLMGYQ